MKEQLRISCEQALTTRSVVDFVEAAKRFCLLIETQKNDNPKEFLEILHGQLLTLYTLGLDLPDILIENDIDFDVSLSEEQILAIGSLIGDRLPFSYYWTVLNPFDEVNLAEMGTGDLTDDLRDIYIDLKKALIQLGNENPKARENAVWQFNFDFNNHWQEHCIDAIYIIFHYLFENR